MNKFIRFIVITFFATIANVVSATIWQAIVYSNVFIKVFGDLTESDEKSILIVMLVLTYPLFFYLWNKGEKRHNGKNKLY